MCATCGELTSDLVLHYLTQHVQVVASFVDFANHNTPKPVWPTPPTPAPTPAPDPLPRNRAHSIPVVFDVYATSEANAASILVSRLDKAAVRRGPIECWWLPNHPKADGSDLEQPRLHWSNQCRDVGDAIANHECISAPPVDWELVRRLFQMTNQELRPKDPTFWPTIQRAYEAGTEDSARQQADVYDRLLAQASEAEEVILEQIAHAAGVIWRCTCRWVNREADPFCGNCNGAKP